MLRIFISYRRDDSREYAGRIFDKLIEVFGKKNVFYDVYSISDGHDFREILPIAIDQSDVVLVLIGNKWLSIKDQHGNRRLDNPDDYVRFEIKYALKQKDCLVIPIMIDDTPRPSEIELPEDIKELIYRQQRKVRRDPDFITDMEKLIESLREDFPTKFPHEDQHKSIEVVSLDVKAYVNHMLERFEAWQKRHTPLFAEFRRFELSVVRSDNNSSIPVHEVYTLKQKLILLGESGSGKTEALWKMVVDCCKKLKSNTKDQIPVKVDLKDWTAQANLRQLVQIAFSEIASSKKAVEAILADGRCLILIDGLNELPSNDDSRSEALSDIRIFLTKYSKNRYVITCRTPDYHPTLVPDKNDEQLPSYEIQRLTKQQIEEYVRRYFEDEEISHRFLTDIEIDNEDKWKKDTAFIQLARIPLLLFIMIDEYRRSRTIPSNKGRVIDVFVRRIVERDTAFQGIVVSLENQKRILGKLGYKAIKAGYYQNIPENVALELVENSISQLKQNNLLTASIRTSDAWKQAMSNNFIIESTDPGWSGIRNIHWLHQLVFDYFVACEINRIIFDQSEVTERKSFLEGIQDPTLFRIEYSTTKVVNLLSRSLVGSHSRPWYQPFQLALGLLDQRRGSDVLYLLLELNPTLARIAFEGQNDEDAEYLAVELIELYLETSDAANRFEKAILSLPHTSMLSAVARVFKRTDIDNQQIMAKMFSNFVMVHSTNIHAKRAFDILGAWAMNKDEIVRFYAAKGLWGQDRGKASEVFNKLLREGSETVKKMIADLMDEWEIY